MRRRIAGLVAGLSLLVFPQVASAWVLEGRPTRERIEPLSSILRAEPPPAPVDQAFPVHGRHDFGTAVNGFGGGRGHQGQDIFADCGTPVVAARAGTVVEVATEGAEGNYVVLEAADGRQQAYLHLLHPHSVRQGEWFGAGERIGTVGQSGNAQGCHLHFELWTAGGRFTGGRVVNPRPALDRWEH
jgi:murein DD-endopeptidase MepM/ murein hydrolase activator NlpD